MNQTELSYLSEIFLFKDIKESEISNIAENCRRVEYASGEVIHSISKPLGGIGIIMSGRAQIVSGRGDTLLRILKSGDTFGAASVFSIEDGNRTAVIATSICDVMIVPENIITEILTCHPECAVNYIKFLSKRIDFLNTRISALAAGDAVAKVAGYLLSLDCDTNGNVLIEDSFTAIASKLNMGRASLYRTIDRFVSDGLISREKNTLTIINRNSLEDIIFKKDPGNSRKRKVQS